MREKSIMTRRIVIWLWGLACCLLLSGNLAYAEDTPPNGKSEPGFKAIFDGKTLDGWDGNPKFWRVEEGAIVGETTVFNLETR
jgi:hypothetical protein